MKKILFSVAILAAFASCSKSEVYEQPQTNAIGFSTLNDRVVAKSANDDGDNYMVYSSYYTATTTSNWYFNVTVNGSDNKPTATQYWPLDGSSLNFYAYAPASESIVPSVSNSNSETTPDSITIDYTVSEDADEDFTVAAAVVNKTSNDGTVSLIFSHMLAKVTVEVVLSENLSGPGYLISEVADYAYTVSLGVANTKGTMEVTSQDWSNPTTIGSHTGARTYMILPQTAAGTTLTVTDLTITDNGGTNTGVVNKNLDSYPITGDDIDGTFEAGKHYYITLTVGSTEIEDLLEGSTISFTSSLINWNATTVGGNETDNTVDIDGTDIGVDDEE